MSFISCLLLSRSLSVLQWLQVNILPLCLCHSLDNKMFSFSLGELFDRSMLLQVETIMCFTVRPQAVPLMWPTCFATTNCSSVTLTSQSAQALHHPILSANTLAGHSFAGIQMSPVNLKGPVVIWRPKNVKVFTFAVFLESYCVCSKTVKTRWSVWQIEKWMWSEVTTVVWRVILLSYFVIKATRNHMVSYL